MCHSPLNFGAPSLEGAQHCRTQHRLHMTSVAVMSRSVSPMSGHFTVALRLYEQLILHVSDQAEHNKSLQTCTLSLRLHALRSLAAQPACNPSTRT